MIGLGYCADCAAPVPLTIHGACGLCGSDAIAPRSEVPFRRVEYEPEGLERVAYNVGEDAA